MSRSINEIMDAWYGSTDEVNRMARDMLNGGMFDTELGREDDRAIADNLLDFMEKPWHWDREHAWWVANEWPDDWQTWERGRDADWEVYEFVEPNEEIARRLKYLRGEIEDESISMSEISELQSLKNHIDPSDVLLLEWAGVPEDEVLK